MFCIHAARCHVCACVLCTLMRCERRGGSAHLGRQATFVRIQRVVQLLSAEPAVCALPSPLGEEAAQPVNLLQVGSFLSHFCKLLETSVSWG